MERSDFGEAPKNISYFSLMPQEYTFTLKYNSSNIADFYLPDLYADYIEYIKKHFCYFHNWTWEQDSKEKLHVHGIITMRASKTPRMCAIKPFHCNYSEVVNKQKWLSYLSKDPQSVSVSTNTTVIYDPKWTHLQCIKHIVTHYIQLTDIYYQNLEGTEHIPEQEKPVPQQVSTQLKPCEE